MGYCEICGTESNSLVKVRTDGSVVSACQKCSKVGNVVEERDRKVRSHTFSRKRKLEKVSYEVIPNYASLINSQMGKRGINMKQLANTLNIKDTTLQKYLSNKVKMDVDTARKFENYFEIKLTQEVSSDISAQEDYMSEKSEPESEENLSLGELLMKKLKEGKK